MRTEGIHSLVVCDPAHVLERLAVAKATPQEVAYATVLLKLLKGRTDRFITPVMRRKAEAAAAKVT